MRNFDRKILITIIFLSFCSIFLLFLMDFGKKLTLHQEMVEIEIDITNKVNICLPEDGEDFEIEYF